jgi:outer membrane protein assembly factor BamE
MFSGDQFKTLETGGPLPSEREFVASIDTSNLSKKARELELSTEQVNALPAPAQPAVVEVEPVGPSRTYPPLEPRQ